MHCWAMFTSIVTLDIFTISYLINIFALSGYFWCISTYKRRTVIWKEVCGFQHQAAIHSSRSCTPARTCIGSVVCWSQITQQELIVKYLGILQFLVVKLLVACNVPWWEYLFKLVAYQHTYSQESWSIVFEKSKHSTTFQMIQVKLQKTSMPMCRSSQPSQG